MPQCCIVPMCNPRTSHRFPSDKKLKAAWLLAINREDYEPSKNARICSKHFLPTDYSMPLDSVVANPRPRLKKDAIPTQFYWTKPTAVMAKGAFKYHGRAMIARVYHFLDKEYEFLKARFLDVDLSPLANILQRTAEATGVSEQTVTHILDEERATKNSLKTVQPKGTIDILDHDYHHTKRRSKDEGNSINTNSNDVEESSRSSEDAANSDVQPDQEVTAELMMKCEVVFEDAPNQQEEKSDEKAIEAYAAKRRKVKTEPDDAEQPKSSSPHQRKCSRSPVRVKAEPSDSTSPPEEQDVKPDIRPKCRILFEEDLITKQEPPDDEESSPKRRRTATDPNDEELPQSSQTYSKQVGSVPLSVK